jgi:hypothetical protein
MTEHLDPVERMELAEQEQLVCDLLGDHIVRRDRCRLARVDDLLDQAAAASPTALAALSTAIAFYEHALNHPDQIGA